MANNKKSINKRSSRKSQSFFEKNKKLIFLLGGLVATVVLITVIVFIVKSKNDDTPKEGGNFGETTGTLDEALNFSDENLYAGYFEDNIADVTVTCVSGTPNCYSVDGGVVVFGEISEDSVYSISGKLKGNIVISVGSSYKFELEMCGFSLVSDTESPIVITDGDEVTLTAKKDFSNYIYDMRNEVDNSLENVFSSAIYSAVDLKIEGKGSLTVVSENNNGIHTKDDLKVKNLTLTVACTDNALKGNDSVTLDMCNTELIVTKGDGIKTKNTDVSSKGKQRGTVTINGGTHTIGAACDGIDAAYDLVINDENTSITVYTDKYSSASEEITATSENTYYLRATSKSYRYSVKYYNSETDYTWVNVNDSYEAINSNSGRPGGVTTYYYYKFDKKTEYQNLIVYMYEQNQTQGQDNDYLRCSAGNKLNSSYDTLALSYNASSLSISWTNYATSSSQGGGFGGGPGGMGGMQDGNTNKKEYSTKGLKAGNAITVNAGTINVKAYDDAVHAGSGTTLENGEEPMGNVTVNGGTLTLYSNDDGIHADGRLTVTNGKITVENSYEGLEGAYVCISGGDISILSEDDGVNGTATQGTAIEISGGNLYIYCTGDGLDSNSRTSYSGIVFSGGSSVIIANSTMNSAIDTENGYTYQGGTVVAIMPRGGMSNEARNCKNFSSIGSAVSMSLTSGKTLTAKIDGATVTVKIPCSISAYVIMLGDKSATASVG